jgi:hypothetical protein
VRGLILISLSVLLGLSQASATDFATHIVPVLTKAGCNAGSCHGAAVGRGGFRLSLYGGDPEADFVSMVRELEGRRIHLSDPDQSLLILKATETIEHGGGQPLEAGGEGVQRIRSWIEQGARWNLPESSENVQRSAEPRRLQQLIVSPDRAVLSLDKPQLPLRAEAHFQDGSVEDVTRWTMFTAEDPAAVEIDATSAELVVRRRGRHILVARYLDHVVPVEVILPLGDQAVAWEDRPAGGLIDRHLEELLQTLLIPLSPPADDATFLRRVTLDLIGRLPDVESTRSFVADGASDRRQRLVERLLQSETFNEYWTMQLAKLLRVRPQAKDGEGAASYHRWLRRQLTDHVGFDRVAQSLLTASGDSHQVGPANFYRTVSGPRQQAELASEVFMGNRLRCANCHNHPLDRWTQDDYHGLAAIFATVRGGQVVAVDPRGVVTHPKTGENAKAKIPGGAFLDPESNPPETTREVFADWLTRHDNPYFAKATVNRLWKAMMGRGLVEPVDDLRATNPATHPALLRELAEDFVNHGYDLRHTLRLIALSDAYARSAEVFDGNENDEQYYSHFLRKPLPPEVLADAISDVLGVAEPYGSQPLGTRAVALVDPQIESRSLDILGRCSREDSCESDAGTGDGGLTLKLHLFNGGLLNDRIAAPGSRLVRDLKSEKSAMEIVDSFYLVALQRPPRQPERRYWQTQLSQATQQNEVLEDFVWSLLSCEEFVTNH